MLVKRTMLVDVKDTKYSVGDIVPFNFTDGEFAQAIAVQQEDDGMLFCLMDCLIDEYSMNNTSTNKGGYENSDLRKKLNTEVIVRFPARLKIMMVPFDNGDLLRLPTEKEIFGENRCGEYENSLYMSQWEPMKQKCNQVALQGDNGGREWYWLQDRCCRGKLTDFVAVHSSGNVVTTAADDSLGVRLVFKLADPAI